MRSRVVASGRSDSRNAGSMRAVNARARVDSALPSLVSGYSIHTLRHGGLHVSPIARRRGVTRSARVFESACAMVNGPWPANTLRANTGGASVERAMPGAAVGEPRRRDHEALQRRARDVDRFANARGGAPQVRGGFGLEAAAAIRDDPQGLRALRDLWLAEPGALALHAAAPEPVCALH